MRYLTGTVGVIAATLFVGYSAVITWNVAHEMTTEFSKLAGWAAAGIVLWECLGLLFVRQCWANGSKWMAVGGMALVLAAAVYTARLDLRFHVAGQSDMAASRTAAVENRQMTRDELVKARAQRDTLQGKKKLSGFEREELETLGTRISALEGKFDTQIVNSGGMPEAGWASRMLSGVSDDEVWWQDALMIFGLVFWALARMLAMPLAVASMGAIRKPQEARTAAKAFEPISVASAPVPAVLTAPPAPRSPMVVMEKLTGVKAPEVRPAEHSEKFASPNIEPAEVFPDARINPPPADPTGPGTPIAKPEAPKVEEVAEARNVVSFFRDNGQLPEAQRGKKKGRKPEAKAEAWLAVSTSQTGNPQHTVTSGECWRSYLAYCEAEDKLPMHRKAFSSKVGVLVGRKTGKGRKRDKNGSVFTGLMINPVMAQARRRVA